MPASKAHDLIVAMITKRIVAAGYQIAAIDSCFDWVFGSGFRLPPTIIRHRPDVLGVRDTPPFLAIGDAKTPGDLGARRTQEQLRDFASLRVRADGEPCLVVLGIPRSGEPRLHDLLRRIGVPRDRILVMAVPDVLLPGTE